MGNQDYAFRLELSDGTIVTIQASARLTLDTLSELLEYLRVHEKHLRERANAAPHLADPAEDRR